LGPSEWDYNGPGGQPRLFGKGVLQSSYCPSFTGTTAAASYIVCGDFSRYLIVHRSGMDVELIPQVFDMASTGRPTAQVGYWAMARYGADVIDNAAFRLLANS
jgi:HK97 family phage major capsid protein